MEDHIRREKHSKYEFLETRRFFDQIHQEIKDINAKDHNYESQEFSVAGVKHVASVVLESCGLDKDMVSFLLF